MKRFKAQQTYLLLMFILSVFFIAGCGGGGGTFGHWLSTDNIAPTVTSTINANGATGVPVNTRVGATFSEAMDPATINTTTFTLKQGTTAVAGTVTYTGVSAVFTPASDLAGNTVYTATITTGATDAAVPANPLATDYSWSWTTGATPDTTAPTVSSTINANGATGVPINTKVGATFSEGMDPLTITTTTFTLKQGTTAVAGTVVYAGLSAVFTPASNLATNTVYTATITTGATDLAVPANPLASDYVWSWTTAATADITAPTVSSTVPVNAATGVARNSNMTATFSEAMDPLTITNLIFTLKQGTTAIAGTVTMVGNTATFNPDVDLTGSLLYTATITTGATDLAGNALASSKVWTFTTGATADITPPTVSSTVPVNAAVGVALNSNMTATFSEAMDPLTITNLTFNLKQGATTIAGVVTYAGVTATFNPDVNLTGNTLYTATITTGAKDLAGNALAANKVWTFTTGATADTTAPTVSSTVPVNAATGVALNSNMTATFSEAMDPLTITNLTFTLTQGGTAVAGAVTYAGVTATFNPDANLTASLPYTATITTGAKDLAGNALAANKVWTFTTGAIADTTAPTVSSTVPVNNATGVALNSNMTATFSEAMDPLTITDLTFTLTQGGTAVAGAVTMVGTTATFNPDADLTGSLLYTATITTGATDLAGNALASSKVWTFTTGATADITPPTVSSTVPVNAAVGVALNSNMTATFSEAMDPLTITDLTFTLTQGGTAVAGNVTYAGLTATFNPDADLTGSLLYTATITTGAKDLAQNALAADYVWTFTTGATPDTTRPTVTLTNPADLAVGVCVNKTINATFSEAMLASTITTGTFTLAPTANLGATVAGVVLYDAVTKIATFNPDVDLTGTPATSYTATIKGDVNDVNGVKDIAGNALATDKVWSFTTNSSTCTTAPALGTARPYGAFAGVTLTNDGLNTIIYGDLGITGASSSVTGLRDLAGNVYTVTTDNDGMVRGQIYTGTNAGAIVTQVRIDTLAAYNAISPANLPGGIDVSSLAACPSCGGAGEGADALAGRTLPPGVYLSTTGVYDIGKLTRVQKVLTLDAGGDADAVWVFQTTALTGTLTVGLTGPATPAVPVQVLLINGAQSKNVFWYVPAGATIGTGATMEGTILSDAATTFSTTGGSPPTAVTTTLNGRALALTAGVTMTNTVVNVPAP